MLYRGRVLYREVVVNVHSITSRLHVHRLSSIPSVCQIAEDREHSGSYQLPIVARFPTDGLLTASPIAASGNLIAWNHDMRTLRTLEQSDRTDRPELRERARLRHMKGK